MNPLTDRVTQVAMPQGTVTVIQPGALIPKGTDASGTHHWRLSKRMFDRYSDILWHCVRAWPTETRLEVPAGLSPNTFEHRLRDARQALLKYPSYEPALHAALVALRGSDGNVANPVFSSDNGVVWFRERGQKGRNGKVPLAASHPHTHGPTAVDVRPTPSDEQAHALCLLLSSGFLVGPIQFTSRLSPDTLATLEANFNVGFAYDERTDITTVL